MCDLGKTHRFFQGTIHLRTKQEKHVHINCFYNRGFWKLRSAKQGLYEIYIFLLFGCFKFDSWFQITGLITSGVLFNKSDEISFYHPVNLNALEMLLKCDWMCKFYQQSTYYDDTSYLKVSVENIVILIMFCTVKKWQ